MSKSPFTIFFPSKEARDKIHIVARKAGKSLNQFILDCLKVYNQMQEVAELGIPEMKEMFEKNPELLPVCPEKGKKIQKASKT